MTMLMASSAAAQSGEAAPATAPVAPALAAPAAAPAVAAPARAAAGPPTADQGASKAEPRTAPEEDAPPTLPWRGTAFKWSQALTTTAAGIGTDVQSSAHEIYTHGYWVLLNYYVLDQKGAKIRLASSPGIDVELTNSDTTTTEREPQLRELNLSTIGSFQLYADKSQDYALVALPNFTLLFPTSEFSRKSGTYLTTSPRLTLVQSFPVLKTDFPQTFALGLAARWDHTFSQATDAVSADLERPTQINPGEPLFTDAYAGPPVGQQYTTNQVSGVAIVHDAVELGGYLYFEGELAKNPLEFLVAASWTTAYAYDFESSDCDLVTLTGCATAQSFEDANQPTATSRKVLTSFDVEVAYYPMPEWGFAFGYSNSANQLGLDGQRRSIFYSPAAMFTARFELSLDALYEGMAGPRRKKRFFLPG